MSRTVPIPFNKPILYNLLAFLINKKLSPEGKGIKRPMQIKLRSFNDIFPDSGNGLDEDDLEQLKSELNGLAEEEVVEIINPAIFENFLVNYQVNAEITLIYTRAGIIEYEKLLQFGDEKAYEQSNSKIEIIIDRDEGVYKAIDPTKISPLGGKRYGLVLSLRDDRVAGFRLADAYYKGSSQTLSHAISYINKNCKLKLGIENDIIIRAGNTGYILNKENFKFNFKES